MVAVAAVAAAAKATAAVQLICVLKHYKGYGSGFTALTINTTGCGPGKRAAAFSQPLSLFGSNKLPVGTSGARVFRASRLSGDCGRATHFRLWHVNSTRPLVGCFIVVVFLVLFLFLFGLVWFGLVWFGLVWFCSSVFKAFAKW